jgi:hypothetical protein
MGGSPKSSSATLKPARIATRPTKDAAVVCSIALQHGITVDVIRHALLRDSHGRASSPLGAVLDIIAGVT